MNSFMMMTTMVTHMMCCYYPFYWNVMQQHVFRPFGTMGYPSGVKIVGSRYFSPTLDFEYYMPVTARLWSKLYELFHRERVVRCSCTELINFVFKRIVKRSDFSIEFTSNGIWHIIEYAPDTNRIAFDGEYCDDFVDMAHKVRTIAPRLSSINLTRYNVVGRNPLLFLHYHLYGKYFLK